MANAPAPLTHATCNATWLHVCVTQADKVYRSVLERYPHSAKLARGFARFLEHVRNDPWRASRFYGQADKLDAEQEDDANAVELGMEGEDAQPTKVGRGHA